MNLAAVLLLGGDDDHAALVGARGVTSYSELRSLVARMHGSLVDAGVEPGDRVGIAAGNDEGFVVAYLGALHAGAVAVPFNPSAPPAELGREVEAVEPRVVLASGTAVSVCSAAGAPVHAIALDDLPDATPAIVERADDDVAVLLFTSGTAGAPKAARLTHRNLAANVAQVLDHPGLRLEPTDVTFGALPFFHVFGLNVVLGVGLAAGGTVVLQERFEPASAAALIAEHGVTVVAGVPTMYAAWLALGDALAADTFASVRLAVSGAAALPEDVADSFRDRFGVVLHQGYGLTEASPIVTTTAIGGGPPRAGSIGPPLPGVDVRIADGDGADALLGDPGELLVRGPNVFPGYWQDDDATARALDTDGWLHTGDVAVVEESGDLHLVDRAKDLVIVSGFNVYPVEVEDVLREHPSVADAAVVGEPNPRTGEAVVAYVVPADGQTIDESALGTHAARALARYKCPTRYEVVDELPRTLAGKVLRRELRG